MKKFKKVNVVLEATNTRSKIALCYVTKYYGVETTVVQELQSSKMQDVLNNGLGFFFNESSKRKPQQVDMFVTTSDKIVKGDWYLSYINGNFIGVYQADSNIERTIDNRTWQEENVKVIATTKPEILKISDISPISNDFILKYIMEYNSGEVTSEFVVEFIESEVNSISTHRPTIKGKFTMFKTSLKDNAIIIKQLQKNFSREEVIECMWKTYELSNTVFVDKEALRKEFDNLVNTLIPY